MIPSPPINDCYLTCFSCWLAARRTPSSHLSSQLANSCTQIGSLNMHPGRSARPPNPNFRANRPHHSSRPGMTRPNRASKSP